MPPPTSATRSRRSPTDFAPDSLALALVNADGDGTRRRTRARGVRCAGRASRARSPSGSRRGGAERLDAEVAGAAWAGAVLAALEALGARRRRAHVARAVPRARRRRRPTRSPRPRAGAVRQLRVVVQAPEFDEALAFYRDVLGMPQAEAYEADGGARVVILDAGRATLELANPAQVAFIDRVETDGGASDRDPARARGRRHRRGRRPPRRRGRRGRGIRSGDAVALAQRAAARARRAAAHALPGARAGVAADVSRDAGQV